MIYQLVPHHVVGSAEVTLDIVASGGLPTSGNYRLRVSGDASIHDVSGNKLDGDNNGVAGGDFIAQTPRPQLAVIANQSIDEGQTVSFTALPPTPT